MEGTLEDLGGRSLPGDARRMDADKNRSMDIRVSGVSAFDESLDMSEFPDDADLAEAARGATYTGSFGRSMSGDGIM